MRVGGHSIAEILLAVSHLLHSFYNARLEVEHSTGVNGRSKSASLKECAIVFTRRRYSFLLLRDHN